MKRINRTIVFSLLGLTLILFLGCNPYKKWEQQEQQEIQQYLKTLKDTVPVLKPSGLYYIELKAGNGRMPVVNDTISIWYKGSLLDGTLFTTNLQDSVYYSFIVGTGSVIAGIDEGVRYMKEGGIANLLTPSKLAYGSSGISGYLSGFTPLLWQIQLAKVRPGSKK